MCFDLLSLLKVHKEAEYCLCLSNVLAIQGLLEDKRWNKAQTERSWQQPNVLLDWEGNENLIQEVIHYWHEWLGPVFIGSTFAWVRQTMCFLFSLQEIDPAELRPELPLNLWLIFIVHFWGWRICSITRGCHSWISITGTPLERGPPLSEP